VFVYRPISFSDLPPIEVKGKKTVSIYCNGGQIDMSFNQSQTPLAPDSTLQFCQCDITTLRFEDAKAFNVDRPDSGRNVGPENAPALIWPRAAGAKIHLRDSTMLYPCLVRFQ
jgi:hypothetical protein